MVRVLLSLVMTMVVAAQPATALEHSFVADVVRRVAPSVVRMTQRPVERQPLIQP